MARVLPFAAGPTRPEGTFGEFYPQISRYALSLLRDPSEADDATQETFLRAHVRQGTLRDPQAALPWLYSIATHVCLDRLRRRARRARLDAQVDPEWVALPAPAATGERHAEQEEMSACVRGYVGDLSDRYRAVVVLHDEYGLTCSEIARLLGDSPGAVKIRLHRARKKLRAALGRGCTFSQDEAGTLVCEPKPARSSGVSPGARRSSHWRPTERSAP